MGRSRTYEITELAEQAGLSLRALRFYEQRGLLTPARDGRRRIYNEDDRLRLRDICRWRTQGFTLTEMKDAIIDGGFSKEKLESQIDHLRRQRDEIDKAIAELMQLAQ